MEFKQWWDDLDTAEAVTAFLAIVLNAAGLYGLLVFVLGGFGA